MRTRNDRGDDRVGHWFCDGAGLDPPGLRRHPSARDHRIISGLLDERLAALPLRCQPKSRPPRTPFNPGPAAPEPDVTAVAAHLRCSSGRV
ncbi:hypothetical protein ACWDAQ_35985, partial [Streptomyces sp. NPDC001139]